MRKRIEIGDLVYLTYKNSQGQEAKEYGPTFGIFVSTPENNFSPWKDNPYGVFWNKTQSAYYYPDKSRFRLNKNHWKYTVHVSAAV